MTEPRPSVADRRGKPVALAAGYLALSCFLGGRYGLIVGAVVLAAGAAGVPSQAFWAAAVLSLIAAPFALMAQGLPKTPIVGSDFGTSHLVAHALVGVAFALATFAALLELLQSGARGAPDKASNEEERRGQPRAVTTVTSRALGIIGFTRRSRGKAPGPGNHGPGDPLSPDTGSNEAASSAAESSDGGSSDTSMRDADSGDTSMGDAGSSHTDPRGVDSSDTGGSGTGSSDMGLK